MVLQRQLSLFRGEGESGAMMFFIKSGSRKRRLPSLMRRVTQWAYWGKLGLYSLVRQSDTAQCSRVTKIIVILPTIKLEYAKLAELLAQNCLY